jgi:hypothetical protein
MGASLSLCAAIANHRLPLSPPISFLIGTPAFWLFNATQVVLFP